MVGSKRWITPLVVVTTVLLGSSLTGAQDDTEEATIKRAVFTTGIEDREPVDQVDSLATDVDKIFFFTEIAAMEGSSVTHRWIHDGETLAEVTFNVGGPRWRVWSSKNLIPTWVGDWTVECVDSTGNQLSEASFVYYAAE